ncbi:hypothetical protein [Borrelia nietonii]|nr:hypothetical protein [Borrelia nietonii]
MKQKVLFFKGHFLKYSRGYRGSIVQVMVEQVMLISKFKIEKYI